MVEYRIEAVKRGRITIRSKMDPDKENDFRLIQSFLEGRSDSFTEIITKYKGMVFNLCFRIMGDYDEADDQAQEVFIKLYRKLHTFRFNCSFTTWLYRVTVNQCRNRLASRAYRRSKNNRKLSPLDFRTMSPELQFEQKQQELRLKNALNRLPVPQKILIVLRDVEGKSYREIAVITSLNQGTVKSRLSRARLRLISIIKEND